MELFSRYFGPFHPLLVLAVLMPLTLYAVKYLQKNHIITVSDRHVFINGLVRAAPIASVFGVIIVAVDLLVRFPAHINVPLPQALLFYPVVGLVVAELHAIVLALLVAAANGLTMKSTTTTRLGIFVVICALPEALLQAVFGIPGKPLDYADIYVGIHVFLFGLAEIYLLLRYGFYVSYSLRLIYYAYWHIVWGTLRLQWLF